jgi:hypothetical protein
MKKNCADISIIFHHQDRFRLYLFLTHRCFFSRFVDCSIILYYGLKS